MTDLAEQTILVTGATGFVGGAVIDGLLNKNVNVRALVRQHSTALPPDVEQFVIGDLRSLGEHCENMDISQLCLSSESELAPTLRDALYGVHVVIHLAARAHQLRDKVTNPLAEFRLINRDVTRYLAEASVLMGVSRFVYLSSIGVNGNKTTDKPFTEADPANPHDDYARSKLESEQALSAISKTTNLATIIIRPPLVCAMHAPGNFHRLVELVKKPIPLPLRRVNNQRSLVALDNLVNFITLCCMHPAAANEVFLVADDEAVSTRELVIAIGSALDKKRWLLPVPTKMMQWLANRLGKQKITDSLLGSLQIDNQKAKRLLEWQPITNIQRQLGKNDQ